MMIEGKVGAGKSKFREVLQRFDERLMTSEGQANKLSATPIWQWLDLFTDVHR